MQEIIQEKQFCEVDDSEVPPAETVETVDSSSAVAEGLTEQERSL
jgi:hypothetical protein